MKYPTRILVFVVLSFLVFSPSIEVEAKDVQLEKRVTALESKVASLEKQLHVGGDGGEDAQASGGKSMTKPNKKGSGARTFVEAFVQSISMIIVSELGDKTFFIAAILAMKSNRVVVFSGAIAALGVMTALSAMMGYALPALLPRQYTHYASAVLFLFFGYKLLKEGYESEGGASSELQEVEEELEEKEHEGEGGSEKEGGGSGGEEADPEVGGRGSTGAPSLATNIKTWIAKVEADAKKALLAFNVPPIFVQTFTMTFLAEWGDRSQIATIALASAKDPYGVTIGGTIGHAICTGIAVLGGRMLASKISEKTVSLAGGALFLVFAVYSFAVGPDM
uniref:GDT1 family protein n=1 Tax=Palpitomonas bilix TaxID=652834 RepID=A0A7S3D9J8_9EUKA|mmetsp:Transcript_28063/g.71527  ORF Transcript_28063/g.71527 Transcript_28063/m.71527 type:complete len:336 (+) Transcript_28063:150-1157(+)